MGLNPHSKESTNVASTFLEKYGVQRVLLKAGFARRVRSKDAFKEHTLNRERKGFLNDKGRAIAGKLLKMRMIKRKQVALLAEVWTQEVGLIFQNMITP